MKTISVQISLYPLRQTHIGPALSKALEVFRLRGLDVKAGTMSTVVIGPEEDIFDSLKGSFQSAAALGDVVMVASISNCCPLPARNQ